MVKLTELRILPPLAVGRLGSSATPLEAFDLVVPSEEPLGYRRITPRETFIIDGESGAVSDCYVPDRIRFKEKTGEIRPVAPFLEVFARTEQNPDELIPLTLDLLKHADLKLDLLRWTVHVANLKIFRRTGQVADKISASVENIGDHKSHDLLGMCTNFLPEKKLPLGSVRFIKPTEKFPEIRLRFTPAGGKVYGSCRRRETSPGHEECDPVICSDDLVLYDAKKGSWRGYKESGGPTTTSPAQIFAGYYSNGSQISWGYLDDECDGVVSVTLDIGSGKCLSAHAHVSAGPPAFAPDSLPIRVVSDELEQILLGPTVHNDDVPIEEAEEIIRRALETVRLMNTAVMNGNTIDGRENVASTMARQDTNDFERLYEPIMAPSIVDNLAVVALHERVFNALASGAAPWFSEALRRPDEIGDLSDKARRKMPGLMRNADGRALTLTHRQIDTIIKAAVNYLFKATADGGTNQGDPDD